MKLLPIKILTIYLATLALLFAGCSSKTPRGTSSTATPTGISSPGLPDLGPSPHFQTTPPEAQVEALPPQQPKPTAGSFIEYSPAELKRRGNGPGITQKSKSERAKFEGQVFHPSATAKSRAVIERTFTFPDATKVSESLLTTVISSDGKSWTARNEGRISIDKRYFEFQSINKCERNYSRLSGFDILCTETEIKDFPYLLSAKEVTEQGGPVVRPLNTGAALLMALNQSKVSCSFETSPLSEAPKISYGAYILDSGQIAENAVREESVQSGLISCTDSKGKKTRQPGEKRRVTVRAYDLASLSLPMVGKGMVVLFEDILQTSDRIIYSFHQKVTETHRGQ